MDRQTFADGSFNDFDYDHRGNLTNVLEHPASGPDKATRYEYDYAASGDRLRKVTYPTTRWVEFFYDDFGRRERMTDSTGHDLRYDYDAAGRLWRLRDATNAVLVEYLYNAAGRLHRVNKGNGTYTTYAYDAAGQLLHLVNHAPNGAVNSRFDYTYDRRGRRVAMGTVDGDWTYDYDATGQLIRARLASTNPQIPNQDLQYNYDPLGNRTYTVTNGVRVDYTANNLNQYTTVGGVAFQYDADGNLTCDGVRTFAYDAQSRLVRVTGPEGVTEYEYNAVGNRTATVLNGARTEYLLDQTGIVDVVAEHEGGGSLVHRKLRAKGLVAQEGADQTVNFLDFDAVGSAVGFTAEGGQPTYNCILTPYGGRLNSSGAASLDSGFVAQLGVSQEANDLVMMRARFYSPEIGRFVQPDPIGLNGGDASFVRYVRNDPVNDNDPIGLGQFCKRGLRPGGVKLPKVGRAHHEQYFRDDGSNFGFMGQQGVGPDSDTSGYSCGGPRYDDAIIDEARFTTTVGDYSLLNNNCQDYAARLRNRYNELNEAQVCLPPPPPTPPTPPGGPPGGGGPGGSGGSGGSGVSSSVDPNEKFGPKGVGVKNWVRGDAVIPYRINFENLGPGSVDGNGNPYSTFASAPAQRVTISDQLHPGLDWSTFELAELGFGRTLVPIPAGCSHYVGTAPMTFDGETFNVELDVGIDLANGRVFVVFQSIDPLTSLPPRALTGFLPPEDGTGQGMGHVSFLVKPHSGLVSGTEIRNIALIEFDRQTSISTDQRDALDPTLGLDPDKQALVTIDAGPPSSSVAALPSESGRTFIVQWSGQDDAGGSGIASYDVLVSTNGSPFGVWLAGTAGTSATFTGELGKAYAFYSVARDRVGHEELPPVGPDAWTLVLSNAPTLVAVPNTAVAPGSSLTVSNFVQGATVGPPRFSLGPVAPSVATINPTNGVLRWTPTCAQASRTFPITIWVMDIARSNIMDAISFSVAVSECVVPGLGRVVLRAGDSGRVPVNLISTVPLTNLSMSVEAPMDRLTNCWVEPIVPEIWQHGLLPVTNNLYWLTLLTCSNQFLIGTQQVAWLHFTAVSNQPSAFVPLLLDNTVGWMANGTPVANFAPQAGRVVVIGEEPLLEAVLDTNRQPALVLYGRQGWDCDREQRPTLDGGPGWQLRTNTVLPDLFQSFAVPVGTNRAQFMRALRR